MRQDAPQCRCLRKMPEDKPDTIALLKDFPFADRLRVEISPRARRISLRVDVADPAIVIVRPRRATDAFVAGFVAAKRRWIERHLARLPAPIRFDGGMVLPLLGVEHRVIARPGARGGVWIEDGAVVVTGAAEHLPRRLKDFLKDHARRQFSDWAVGMAARLGVRVARVAVRDTSSRWGSCTRSGRISLSWRLVLAPPEVAAYVVAHEVAHLRHMNHSPAFWRTVEGLIGDMKKPRAWLLANGAGLYRYN